MDWFAQHVQMKDGPNWLINTAIGSISETLRNFKIDFMKKYKPGSFKQIPIFDGGTFKVTHVLNSF